MTMASPIVPAALPDAAVMDDAPIPLNLERVRPEKRRASKEATDEFQIGEEKKAPRLTHPDMDSVEVEDALMRRLERKEKETLHVATEDYYMAMTTCEDGVDFSYMKSGKAKMLCEAIGCTDVGLVRGRLDRQLNQCMLAELVEPPGLEVPGGLDPARDDSPGEDAEESIFDYGSKMGQLPYAEGDSWVHDKVASSWARVIVVLRREFPHPSEGDWKGLRRLDRCLRTSGA